MDDDLKDASKEAWKEVLAHPAANLKKYLESKQVVFTGGAKPAADFCPLCKGKKKFGLGGNDADGWVFKCFGKDCAANEGGGMAKFIELERGCDWKEARRILHEITGVPDLYAVARERREKKKEGTAEAQRSQRDAEGEAVKPIDTEGERSSVVEEQAGMPDSRDGGGYEIEVPDFLRVPDIGRNCYEEVWALLTLTAAHRAELRTKRGLPDSWIDALGFKSSVAGNRALLEPVLSMFPPNELLRAGIATRRSDDWKRLKITDQLCGGYWEKDEETREFRWNALEMVIIPYIDDHGRIVSLRPHKRGLSNTDYREDEASEFYEKNHHNMTLVYGEHFLLNRPEQHAHRCMITEGEFKADGVAYCGIPAIGFQGITFLRNNHSTGQAVSYLVALLRKHKIREVVVCFDTEDKQHKPVKHEKDRFIAEIHARNTGLILENHGFKVLYGMMPDEWMEGGGEQHGGWTSKGKADWDGRLAWHLRKARGNFLAARKTAGEEFEKFLNNRLGKVKRVVPVPRQMDFMASHKEDVIWQELNRLQFEPDCFIGSKHDIEVAAEITGYCHPRLMDLLNVENVAKELRKCYGGYYMIKPPAEKLEAKVIHLKATIKAALEEQEPDPEHPNALLTQLNKEPHTEEKIRSLRAALLACNTILYKMPKVFSNFSIVSYYKVLVTEPDGGTRKDRLCVFIDAHGRKSKPMQVNWEKMSSSQEARKIFLKFDGYHFKGGQAEIDALVPTIDVNNYQKTIIEIDTYGLDRESGLILLGDCALSDNPEKPFLFPDANGIIWHRSIGYKNSEILDTFCHKPPMLFPGEKKPKEFYQAMDWDKEREEVAAIWKKALRIACDSFGDFSGYAMVGSLLAYLVHPETLEHLSGKPGLWVQGAKGSGKTHTVMCFMRMLGYVRNYGLVGLSGTKVGLERSLSQYDCLPVHIDEWRNNRADDNLVGFITNGYNGISIAKGTATGSKSIRLSRAATMPVVTGEDMTTDTALLSRCIRLTMSASARQGTKDEQQANFAEMQQLAEDFYRIGRFLMRRRKEFANEVVQMAKIMKQDKRTLEAIKDDRARECTSICCTTLVAAQKFITGEDLENEFAISKWFLDNGRSSSADIEKDVFRLRWFTDCVSLITGGMDPHAKNFLQVRRGGISADGSINILKGNQADILYNGKGQLLILIAPAELDGAYQREQSRQRKSVPIDIRNIRHELRKEPGWIPPPQVKGNGSHRFTVEGFRPQSWWVIAYDASRELRDIVSPIYERLLYEHDLELDESGQVRLVSDQEPLRI